MRTLIPLLLIAGFAFCQDDELPPDAERRAEDARAEEEAARLLLSTALKRLHAAEHVVARGKVSHEKKEAARPGGMGAAVLVQTSTNLERPFEGDFEAWHASDGTTVIVSESRVPGFGLYIRDGRTVKETLAEEDAPSLEQVRAELGALMDVSRLVRHLRAAELAPARDGSGDVVFEGEVPRGIVRRMSAESRAGMAKRVLGAEARLVVSRAGRLKSARIRVRHSDDLQRMIDRQVRKVRIQVGAGGGVVPVPQEDDAKDDDEHDVETGSTTYALTFDEDHPSERAQQFKRRIERALGR